MSKMDKNFWVKKKILLTGGSGFLGKSLVPKLKEFTEEVFTPRSSEFDLRKEEHVRLLFKKFHPDIVIHAAVHGGGIGHMRNHPGSIYYDNIMMNTLIVEESRKNDVEKFVGIGTICSYPKYTPVPFKEENLWNGYPEETNAPYGLAKKMMLVQTQGYCQEYGFNGIHLLLVNMYGPHDDFDLETSHVIPALIRKCVTAISNNEKEIICWGDGNPTREFLYVEDAVEGILLAAEKYNKPDPVNLGTGSEISIKDLVSLIVELTGFKGKIVWDPTKPNGQPKRKIDTSKAFNEFGFKAKTDFREGLIETINWYRKQNR